MSDERNPYATTSVPLEDRDDRAELSEYTEYGGFWIRLGAAFLDGLILLPISGLVIFGGALSRLFYFYYLVPGLLFLAFYYIYLVMANGGTPGKRILKMRIVMADGTPVLPKAAILRNVVEFGLGGLSTLALALAGLSIADAEYNVLGWVEKTQVLQGHTPPWYRLVMVGTYGWYVISVIVMLCNDKRRSLHDFLAGTVVVRGPG